jgi:hypothetical protein
MKRRGWVVAFGVGLSAGLASGCLPATRSTPSTPIRPAPDPVAVLAEQDGREVQPASGIRSDYQMSQTTSATRSSRGAAVEPVQLAIKEMGPPASGHEEPAESAQPDRPASPAPASPPAPRPEPPLVAALRATLDRRPVEEIEEPLQGYPPAQRALLLDLLRGTARVGSGGLDHLSSREAGKLLDQLDRLAPALCARAPLVLSKMCFCRKGTIDNFGQYQPLGPVPPCFQAGDGGRPGECVQVYVEVRNFASRHVGEFYETELKGSLEIHETDLKGSPPGDQDGPVKGAQAAAGSSPGRAPVFRKVFAPCADRSRSLRHDYFVNFQFPIPPHCPAGLYTLWVQVEDLTLPGTPRIARRSLDFRVAADGLVRQTGEGPDQR